MTTIFRSSKTGRFVTPSYAKKHPATTVKETIHAPGVHTKELLVAVDARLFPKRGPIHLLKPKIPPRKRKVKR